MIALNIDRLSLSFGTKVILDGVTFAADEADRIGIIGSNGAGKSTLFRLILGELTPDSGHVYRSKDKTVGILRQNEALERLLVGEEELSALELMYRSFPDLLAMEEHLSLLEQRLANEATEELTAEYTALNEAFIREGGLEFRGRCASTLRRMGFDEEAMHRPFSTFSGGQRTRLALSRELCREPDILMLDWLEQFLMCYKKCVLVISHDRYFLDRVTTKTLCIEHHKAKLYNGGYTKSMEQRRIDREIEERHWRNQQKEIARQEAYIAQQRRWNRERNIIAAESRLKLLDKMEKLERPQEDLRAIRMSFSSSAVTGNDVLTVRDLAFSYTPSVPLLRPLSFLVKRGDRLFFVGPNGCGKSTLIKLLLGKLAPTSGYVDMGYNVNVGYYDQENQQLNLQNTVLEELWHTYPAMTETAVRTALSLFRFFGEDVFKEVSEISGGERARLTLCKLMLSDVNVLVLDEPTNHLDIDSREALEQALSQFDGTILVVSHDRYLIDKLATRIIDLTPSAGTSMWDIHVETPGQGYEELCRDRKRRADTAPSEAEAQPIQAVSSQKEQYLKNKQNAAELRRAQKRLERLRAEAERIEAELETIETEMQGEAATDYVRLSELDTKKNELEERLLEIYEETEQ